MESFQVWIGNAAGFSGCGVIVDRHHVVTCNHVVRQCLGWPLYGGAIDDLKGEILEARVEGLDNDIEMVVVSIHPYPSDEPGKNAYDDLCLLKVSSPDVYFNCFAKLFHGTLAYGTNFLSQGVAARQPPTDGYGSLLCEGKIKVRAEHLQWYQTYESEKHLQSHPGFSGSAVRKPDSTLVYGLIQGCAVPQIGYIIPAKNILDFLNEHGVEAERFHPPASFRRTLQPSTHNLTSDKLAHCDRDDQAKAFDTAKRAFFEKLFDHQGSKLFALGIVGLEDDLPDLLQRRLGSNGVQSYKELRRLKFKDAAEIPATNKISPFPIGLEYEEPERDNLRQFVIEKLANASTADGSFLASMADEDIVISALAKFDVPVLIVVHCPQRLFDTQMVSAWTECLDYIARVRHSYHPIIVVMVVAQEPNEAGTPPLGDDDFLMLPQLGELGLRDVGRWLDLTMPGDSRELMANVKEQFGDQGFRMKKLHDYLFPRASE